MPEAVVVIGAGGFGRETLDVIEAVIADGANLRLTGVVDSGPRAEDLERLRSRGVDYLGKEVDWLASCAGSERFVVAIGNPQVRRGVAARFEAAGLSPISLVHPRAGVGSQVSIGQGVVIAAGAEVSTNVQLGDHVHLNPGCIIGHDAIVETFVSVNPGAIVSGNVSVGSCALIGAGSVVLQGLSVGAGAIVGAGACVTKDVSDEAVVVGIPARPLRGRANR